MAEIVIEKKVKLPKRSKYPFGEMKVGDSFEAGDYSTAKARSLTGSICYFKGLTKENSNKVFSARKTEDGKLRVWRTA